MSQIVIIENDFLRAEISSLGAEIQSLKKNNKEYIWQGKKDFWNGHAPILFPVCGGLVEDKYTLNGNTYSLSKHGFAKNKEFKVINKEKTEATFLITDDENTFKSYPFKFELYIMYQLSKNSLRVYYIVKNLSNETMYFNVGAHEAYALESKINDYSVEFTENNDYIEATKLKNGVLGKDKFNIALENGEFSSGYNIYNEEDSLVFENIKSKRVYLNKGDETILSVYFKDFDNMLLWTQNNAEFLAIEPWNGLPDLYDTDGNLKDKKGVDKIESGESKTFYHSVTIE